MRLAAGNARRRPDEPPSQSFPNKYALVKSSPAKRLEGRYGELNTGKAGSAVAKRFHTRYPAAWSSGPMSERRNRWSRSVPLGAIAGGIRRPHGLLQRSAFHLICLAVMVSVTPACRPRRDLEPMWHEQASGAASGPTSADGVSLEVAVIEIESRSNFLRGFVESTASALDERRGLHVGLQEVVRFFTNQPDYEVLGTACVRARNGSPMVIERWRAAPPEDRSGIGTDGPLRLWLLATVSSETVFLELTIAEIDAAEPAHLGTFPMMGTLLADGFYIFGGMERTPRSSSSAETRRTVYVFVRWCPLRRAEGDRDMGGEGNR
jgi:hypothetical protein